MTPRQKFRSIIIQERGCKCERCGEVLTVNGFNMNGLNIHHRMKIRTHPHLRFDRFNVLLLCKECHYVCERFSL